MANLGNIPIVNFEDSISSFIYSQLSELKSIISIGGDHSITYPIIKGFLKRRNDFSILHFDAHPDLYDNFDDNQYSHASPFARIMESSFAGDLYQIGIRTLNDHQKSPSR